MLQHSIATLLLTSSILLCLVGASDDTCPHASVVTRGFSSIQEAKKLQLRIAVGNHKDSMLITWSSPNTTVAGRVQVRVCGGTATSATYFDGSTHAAEVCYTLGSNVHYAEAEGLMPDTLYHYSVQDAVPSNWSNWMSFRTPPREPGGKQAFALIGDLGVTFGGPVTRAISSAVDAAEVDMVVHNGDIGYADSEIAPSNGTRYQDFLDYHFQNVSRFASRVPYMLTPGNHEAPCNYQEFDRRAVRPALKRGDYYSFTRGVAHFIMLSAERGQLSGRADDSQTIWIQQELKTALQMKRNGSIKWLFTFIHYPAQPFGYCTYNLPFCRAKPSPSQEWFEDLFVSHEVDIHFTAHQHAYERTYPVYRQHAVLPNASVPSPHAGMFPNGTRDIFMDPAYPMYLVNGAAGDDVVFPPNWLPPPEWSAQNSRSVQFGFSVIQISADRIDVSYRVPLEAEPGVQKVFPMDEFSIIKTPDGQRSKNMFLQPLVRSASATTFV